MQEMKVTDVLTALAVSILCVVLWLAGWQRRHTIKTTLVSSWSAVFARRRWIVVALAIGLVCLALTKTQWVFVRYIQELSPADIKRGLDNFQKQNPTAERCAMLEVDHRTVRFKDSGRTLAVSPDEADLIAKVGCIFVDQASGAVCLPEIVYCCVHCPSCGVCLSGGGLCPGTWFRVKLLPLDNYPTLVFREPEVPEEMNKLDRK